MPGEVEGQYFEKIEYGIIAETQYIYLKFYFLVIFNLKSALCVYGEYAKQRKNPEISTYIPTVSTNFGPKAFIYPR